jgi:site-specific DNA recombinase
MKSKKTKTVERTNKNAAIYVRVSGEYDERTASLDSQKEACQKLVEQNGFTVSDHHVFVERHTGKHLHQRKELQRLRAMVEAGEVSCVCFYQIDRLSRGGSGHIWILLHEFRTKGIKLLSVHDDLSDTPMNNMMLSVKAEIAAQELLNLKDRTMRGMRKKIEGGQIPGWGGEMFGYRINKETWKREFCEPEAQIIRRIFEDIASGKSTNKIATDLNVAGVPSPATSIGRKNKHNTWYRGTINAIIQNAAYCGKQKFQVWHTDEQTGKKTKNPADKIIDMPDVTPPIVSEELWVKANAALRDRRSLAQMRNRGDMNILRGLVYCLKCGRKMHSKTDGRGYQLFACSSRADENLLKQGIHNCGAPSISKRWLTHWVWYVIRLHLSDPENLKKIVDDLSTGDHQKELLLNDRERLEKRIEEIEQESARLFRQLAKLEDQWLIEMCHQQLGELTKQRSSIDRAIHDVAIQIVQLERTRPNVTSLYELAEQLFYGDEEWSDEEQREKLLAGRFRIYAAGHSFEVRIGSENVIRRWEAALNLIARDDVELNPVVAYERGSE